MADLKTTNIFGDAYINNKVGIATNTPATRLQIGQLSPTAATEGLQFGDDINTRIYRSAAGIVTISGSLSAVGNVGIGTTTVDHPLEVYGGSMDPSLTTNAASIFSVNSLGVELAIGRMVTTPFSIWLQGKHATVGGNLTYPMVLNPLGGNVGIGTTSPAYTLHVEGTGTQRINVVSTNNSSTGAGIYFQVKNSGTLVSNSTLTIDNVGNLKIFTGTSSESEKVRIDSGGNVGIGTTSPVGKLTVQGNIEVNYNSITADSSVRRSFLTSHATTNRGANITFGLLDGASVPSGMTVYNTAAAVGAYNSQFIGFNTHEGGINEGERMRITSLGNVGIGTTNPTTPLHVVGIISGSSFSGPGTGLTGTAASLTAGTATTATTANALNTANNYTVNNLRVTSTVGVGTTSPQGVLEVQGSTDGSLGGIGGQTQLWVSDNRNQTTGVGGGISFAGEYINSSAAQTTFGAIRGSKANSTSSNTVGNLELYAFDGDFKFHSQYSQVIGVNTELVTIKADGKVGIGTISPAYKLDVAGSINTSNFMFVSYPYGNAFPLQLTANNFLKADNYYYGMSINSGDVNFISGKFLINGGTYKRVELYGYENGVGYIPTVIPGGNVGIGTTAPSQKLHLVGAQIIENGHSDTRLQLYYPNAIEDRKSYLTLWASEPGLSYNSCGIGGNINFSGQNYGRQTTGSAYGVYMRFDTGTGNTEFYNTTGAPGTGSGQGTRAFYIDSSGNAIATGGTRSTYADIGSTSGDIYIASNLNRLGQTSVPTVESQNASKAFVINHTGAQPILFGTSGSERIRIASDGNVGIGTTAPSTLLHAYGSNGRYFTYSGTSGAFTIQRNVITTAGVTPVLSLINTQAMDAGTNRGTSIQLDLGYGGSASVVGTAARGARIAALCETGYDATAANQNAGLAFFTSTAGILTEKLRIRSDGSLSPVSISSTTAGATLLRTDGTNGTLFSVVDDLSDSLMSVNNSAGLPVLEVFADDRIVAGQYGQNDFVVVNNKVGIGTNNPVAKLHVTSSTSIPSAIFMGGNVGIGTTSPVGKLDVRAGSGGEIIFGSYDANYTVRVQSGDQLNFYNGASAGAAYINYAGGATVLSQNLHVEKATGGTTGLVRIKADGNVGIGTTLPTTPLHVVGVISGSSFSGAGTGLTGTAANLTAGTANSVAWTNVSSRPTTVSSFTNDIGYLTSVTNISGNAATATTVNGQNGQLLTKDIRTIAPNNISAEYLQFGFTAWNNNGNTGGIYADYLHLRSYADSSGGLDNLLMFRKIGGLGIRLWQQTFGSATAYATYKDVCWTDGTNANGTWAITSSWASNAVTALSCTGNAGSVTNGVYTTGAQSIGGVKSFTSTMNVVGVKETMTTVAASSAVTINLNLGTIFKLTFSSTVSSFTITNSDNTNVTAGNSFTLISAPDNSNAKTLAFSFTTNGSAVTVKWANGATAPTATITSNKFDVFSFVYDGTNWFGFTGGLNY